MESIQTRSASAAAATTAAEVPSSLPYTRDPVRSPSSGAQPQPSQASSLPSARLSSRLLPLPLPWLSTKVSDQFDKFFIAFAFFMHTLFVCFALLRVFFIFRLHTIHTHTQRQSTHRQGEHHRSISFPFLPTLTSAFASFVLAVIRFCCSCCTQKHTHTYMHAGSAKKLATFISLEATSSSSMFVALHFELPL